MSLQMSTLQKEFEVKFLNFSEDYFLKLKTHLPEVSILWESIQYSLNSGGKRFRPFLSYLVSLAKKHDSQIKLDEIIPFSLAVEMIHTYSLIHDDLPCMDNDDYRRGQPTNHKVYGEDIALLAGDTLLTLSFSLVAEAYRDRSDCAVKLIQLLTQNAGPLGMIGGQVLDIKSAQGITALQIKKMHNLKTGALIEASVIGAALICNYNADEISNFSSYGKALGLAFQIKDDILDADDRDQDYKNFVSLIGLEATQKMLTEQSQIAYKACDQLSFIIFNRSEILFNITKRELIDMRLDQFLVKHKEVDSRTKAQDLIEKGHVYLSDPASGSKQTLRKSSFDVTDEIQFYIHIEANELSRYVSRAGLKLEGALKHTGLDVMFKYILDLGQSTGGFTDCLLQNGARKVIGVDVGSGQLHDKLLGHPQVISIENLNIKEIANNEQFQKTTQVNLFDIIVGDVSFISLTKFIQFAEPFLKPSGFYLLLVKPQFECGPEYLDKNGVVQDSAIYEKVENDIINHCQRVFGGHLDYFESSIKGKDGNREFFIYGQKTK